MINLKKFFFKIQSQSVKLVFLCNNGERIEKKRIKESLMDHKGDLKINMFCQTADQQFTNSLNFNSHSNHILQF